MSDQVDKVLAGLDKIEARMNDYEKSREAAEKAAKEGDAVVAAEIAEVRKQNQELAALVRRGIPSTEKDMHVEMSKTMAAAVKDAVAGRSVSKAATEGTAADGGYTVAPEYQTAIKTAQNQYGVARRLVEFVPMASNQAYIATDTFEETSGNVPEPSQVSEAAQISESAAAKVNQVSVTAYKQACLTYVSRELADDSFVSGGYLSGFLLPKLARRKAKREDTIVIVNGIIGSNNVLSLTLDAGKTSFEDLHFDDIRAATDKIVDDAMADGQVICHRTIESILCTLKDSEKRYIWKDAPSMREQGSIWGMPVNRASVMKARSQSASATGFMIVGDPRLGCVVGERLGMSLETSKDFKFDYDLIAVKLVWRMGYGDNSDIGRAVCVIKTASA